MEDNASCYDCLEPLHTLNDWRAYKSGGIQKYVCSECNMARKFNRKMNKAARLAYIKWRDNGKQS